MASNAMKLGPPLSRLQIFPRQTIRAVISILRSVVVQQEFSRQYGHINQLSHQGLELLKDSDKIWPLTVQVESPLWQTINTLVVTAKKIVTNFEDCYHLSHYLTTLPDFYDYVDVNGEGRMKSLDVIVWARPLGVYISTDTVPSLRKKKKYEKRVILKDSYRIEEDPRAREEFDSIFKAAQFKSELYPYPSARNEQWKQRRQALLESPPNMVPGMLLVGQKEDRLDTVEQDASHSTEKGLEEQEITDETCKLSISDDDYTDVKLTPSETHSSSVEIERPIDSDTPKDVGLKLSYYAILETADEKVTININPTRVEGPESKVLDATKEMWSWMRERGVDDKVQLEDVVELAREMITSKEDGVAGHA